MIRLNKFLSMCGVCSRRKADELILNKKILVNGKNVSQLGMLIDEKKDEVKYEGKVLKVQERKIYIMLNKPAGYITTSKEQFGRPSVLDLITEKERVFPVGRLDMDTEGLLILTNDGEFANNLMHPSKKIEKTYTAKVLGNITEDKINKLKNGVKVEDYITAPAKVRMLSKNSLEIIIHEGKNREVKKMCKAVGLKVEKLRRTKIGSLELGNLEIGKYTLISEEKIKLMFKQKTGNF